MVNNSEKTNENMTKWSTNETLVQSYRSCFFSTQSILLAFAAIINEANCILSFLIFFIGLFQIALWFSLIRARTLIVDFYKFNFNIKFDNKGNELVVNNSVEELKEETYVHNSYIREKVNKQEKIANIRETRFKIDRLIPLTFALLWVIVMVNVILKHTLMNPSP